MWSQDLENSFFGPQIYFPLCGQHNNQNSDMKAKSKTKKCQNVMASWLLITNGHVRFYLNLKFGCPLFFSKLVKGQHFENEKKSVVLKLAPEF